MRKTVFFPLLFCLAACFFLTACNTDNTVSSSGPASEPGCFTISATAVYTEFSPDLIFKDN